MHSVRRSLGEGGSTEGAPGVGYQLPPPPLCGTSPAPPQPDRKLTLERLKRRADFLRVAKGIRRVTAGLTLEMSPMPEQNSGVVRVGFTASRKVGGAVERNRAKRRLRAAAEAVLPLY